MVCSRGIRALLACTCIGYALSGCATRTSLPESHALDFRSRAITCCEDCVRVATSVLTAEESLEVYGVPLARRRIQPVWIEVENRDDEAYWLMSPGVDPDFLPPTEAADAFAADSRSQGIERRFRNLAFDNPVLPGETVSGFVLTNRDEGVKIVQVDLVASGRLRAFSFLNSVPGFHADYHSRNVFRREFHPSQDVTDFTDDAPFRSALEQLPCCVTGKDGSRKGAPPSTW